MVETMTRPGLLALLAFGVLSAGCVSLPQGPGAPDGDSPDVPRVDVGDVLSFLPPVDLQGIGYEPGIAADSKGNLFYTAHKDLERPDSWPYPGSWFAVSRDQGKTWVEPDSPGAAHTLYVGDEGDIAIDGRDWIYFEDTYLADGHFHVWSDGGRKWEYSLPAHRSSQADDRPWLFAQGNGIVHYLGNNGASVPGERYIYYRSADGGLTWTPGTGLPSIGWAHGEAERNGDYAYMAQYSTAGAGAATDVIMLVSADQGATWGKPSTAAHYDSVLRYPIVAVGGDRAAYVMAEVGDGDSVEKGTRVSVSKSSDHGATWTTTDVSPFTGYLDYFTGSAGPDGSLGLAFYGTKDLPVSDKSEWRLYAGVVRPGADVSSVDFTLATPGVLYAGRDLQALHDFFEVAMTPDGAMNIAYQRNTKATDAQASQAGDMRHLMFVRSA